MRPGRQGPWLLPCYRIAAAQIAIPATAALPATSRGVPLARRASAAALARLMCAVNAAPGLRMPGPRTDPTAATRTRPAYSVHLVNITSEQNDIIN